MKKLTKEFLKEMQKVGKESAISTLKLKGFSYYMVPFGYAVTLQPINDFVYIWLNKSGGISKITTCNPDQTIESYEIDGLSGRFLSEVIQKIKDSGFSEEDYSRLEFVIDYSDCYYEGDTPGISLCYE